MQDTMKELDTLLNYLINHNKDHADEIIDLAEKALALEKNLVHEELMLGVEALNRSNEHLMHALQGLRRQ